MPAVTVNGGRVFYEDCGEGFPLVFGQSYLWDARMWDHQVAALSRSHRCIVPELWGHGRSSSPPGSPYSIEALAADHAEFADRLNLDRYALIGLSVGGMWSTNLALNRPEAVSALVLLGTDLGPEPPENRDRDLEMLDMVEEAAAIPPPLLEAIVPLFFSPVTMEREPHRVEDYERALTSPSRRPSSAPTPSPPTPCCCSD